LLFSRQVSARTAPAVVAALLLCALPVQAQSERGRVASAQARWETNNYGDQRIVTEIEIDLPSGRVSAHVEGGTLDGLTLAVSGVSAPLVGGFVDVRRTGRGWQVVQQDFATFGKWAGDVSWLLNPANADMSQDAAELDAIAAFSAWVVQSQADVTVTYSGRTASTVQARDLVNNVFFRPTANPDSPNALASTYCWSNSTTGLISDCDVVIWDGYVRYFSSTTACTSGAFLLDVLTHEFGHFAGLNHSTVAGATMTPGYSGCSTTQRTLEPDDIAGIEVLYPVVTEPPPPDPDPEPPPPCKKKGRWAC